MALSPAWGVRGSGGRRGGRLSGNVIDVFELEPLGVIAGWVLDVHLCSKTGGSSVDDGVVRDLGRSMEGRAGALFFGKNLAWGKVKVRRPICRN